MEYLSKPFFVMASLIFNLSAHIPALKLIAEVELIVVRTTKMSSAKKNADNFGARYAFDNEYDLINHPYVNLVAILA